MYKTPSYADIVLRFKSSGFKGVWDGSPYVFYERPYILKHKAFRKKHKDIRCKYKKHVFFEGWYLTLGTKKRDKEKGRGIKITIVNYHFSASVIVHL